MILYRSFLDHQAAYCTISSASMSILPRPGSLFAAGDTLPIDRYFMKCRLRYISFFAVGIDSRYLAIVSVLGPQSVCHVLKILPNALRVSDVLQEQIIVSGFHSEHNTQFIAPLPKSCGSKKNI